MTGDPLDTEGTRHPAPDAPDGGPDDAALDHVRRMADMARAGDPTLVAHVDEGVPADLTDAEGNTLLMLAASHGHTTLVRALLERDADPGHPNDDGRTPLAAAVTGGHPEVVRALVAAGADPDAGAPSAIEAARTTGREDLLALLR